MNSHASSHPVSRWPVYLIDIGLLGVVTAWGINYVVIKAALDQFRPLEFAALRLSLGSIIMIGFVASGLRRLSVSSGDVMRLIVLGTLGFGITQAMFISGVDRTSASNAALIQSATPIIVALINHILSFEIIPNRGWIGVVLSLAGVVLVIGGSPVSLAFSSPDFSGNLLIVGATIGWAAYIVMARPLVKRLPASTVAGSSVLVGAIGLLVFAAPSLTAKDWSVVTSAGWLGLLYSGAITVGMGNIIWAKGIQRLGGTRTSVYFNLVPVFAVLSAAIFLDERLVLWQIVGGIAVLSGIFLTRRRTSVRLGGGGVG